MDWFVSMRVTGGRMSSESGSAYASASWTGGGSSWLYGFESSTIISSFLGSV